MPRRLAAVLGTALLALVAIPAVRPLAELASRPSPPVAAMAALREDPGLRGRPLLVDPGLWVHRKELGPRGVPWRELKPGRSVVAPPRGLVVTHDGVLPGLRPLRDFRLESDVLRRISRARYLRVTIWDVGSAPDARPFKATDDDLLSSVDEPPEGAVVRPPLFVRGWCQERGGGLVVPVEFRVDGVAVVPERLVRTARPDVAAAIPEVGDASRAGYEATPSRRRGRARPARPRGGLRDGGPAAGLPVAPVHRRGGEPRYPRLLMRFNRAISA